MPDARSRDVLPPLYTRSDIERRLQKAQRHVNFDDDEMEEIICQYIKDTPAIVDSLLGAWERSDFDNIIIFAHSLVGVTRLLYLHDVGEYARTIEDLAKINRRPGETTMHQLLRHHRSSLAVLRGMYPCPELPR